MLHILLLVCDSCSLLDHSPAWGLLYSGCLCLFCHKPKYSYRFGASYVFRKRSGGGSAGKGICAQSAAPKEPSPNYAIIAFSAAVSSLSKNLTCPVDDAQVFKDSADKKFESLLKSSFYLAGSAVQPAVATICICQSLKHHLK